MKRNIPLLFALLWLTAPANAQWTALNSGTSLDLFDLHFPSAQTGYAVGATGTVVKTVNAGETWQNVSVNTGEVLSAVWFISETTGFVAGDEHLFKTTDGGSSWSAVTIPTGNMFRDLFFLDAQTGFCVGGDNTILKTTDGGETWTLKTVQEVATLSSIHFATPQIGYAVGTGYNWSYLKTIDGGETWTDVPINTPAPHLSNLETVFFTAEEKGFIGGWYLSALITTSNEGDNWSFVGEPDEPQLYAMHFPSPSRGYAVGWHGQIMQTTDNGETWTRQVYGNGGTWYAVQFTDDNTGYIAGYNGLIIKTTNGGVVTRQTEASASETPVGIYPNPASGVVQVDLSVFAGRAVRLSVYDVQGNRLKVQEADVPGNLQRIDLSACASGLYFLCVQADGLPAVVKRVALVQR